MVVLVLIGIIFTFAMLSVGGDNIAEEMKRETQRMVTLLNLASDEAVLRGEELAVLFSEDGYEFLVLNVNRWQPSGEDGLLKAYTMPADIELRLEIEGEPPILTALASGTDDTDDKDKDEDEDELEPLKPQVFILSSGEMTPFTVILESRQSRKRYHLTASLLGAMSWEVEDTL